jgi:hypothetical protein
MEMGQNRKSITVRIRRPCVNIHYGPVSSPWLLRLRKTRTQDCRWTTAKISHIRVPFNCQRTDYIRLFFMSVSPPSCLSPAYFLPNVDRNFELPSFNVFVQPLDFDFVLNNIFPHLVHYFWLCPSFRYRYSANILKYSIRFAAFAL